MKKQLLAYKTNGQIIGIDLESWSDSDLNGNKPFLGIFSGDTIPDNYEDISSIGMWHKFGNMVANDYLVIKDQIKILMMEMGWDNLTNNEKDLCIKYYALPDFVKPIIYLMTVKSMNQFNAQLYIIDCWHNHHKQLLDVCKERWYYVKLSVAGYLNFSDAEELMDLAGSLIFNFIECGRFGKEYGDQRDGLLDFIISKHAFEGQGLQEQGYVLNFGTYEQFIGTMVSVLLHGIYNKKNN